MEARIDYFRNYYQAVRPLVTLGQDGVIEESLLDLVKIRASQINHCAYCIDMHIKDARTSGETEQRLYSLNAWRETPFYSDRERAALAWTEAVTLISENGVSDELYAEMTQHFSEQEIFSLTMTVVTINSWNRINVSFRKVPGDYESRRKPAHALSEAQEIG